MEKSIYLCLTTTQPTIEAEGYADHLTHFDKAFDLLSEILVVAILSGPNKGQSRISLECTATGVSQQHTQWLKTIFQAFADHFGYQLTIDSEPK
jgi:hypothetical protein